MVEGIPRYLLDFNRTCTYSSSPGISEILTLTSPMGIQASPTGVKDTLGQMASVGSFCMVRPLWQQGIGSAETSTIISILLLSSQSSTLFAGILHTFWLSSLLWSRATVLDRQHEWQRCPKKKTSQSSIGWTNVRPRDCRGLDLRRRDI